MSKRQRKTHCFHTAVLSAGPAVSLPRVQHFPNASGNSRSWKRRTSCDTTQLGKRLWRPSVPETQLNVRRSVLLRVARGVSRFPSATLFFFFFFNSCCFEQKEIRANTICHSHWEGKLKGCMETCWYDSRVCMRQGMWWVETLCRLWAWQENGKCETKAAEADHNQPGLRWCAASSWAFISCLKVESVAVATKSRRL